MANPLFATFLEDPAVYRACEDYWRRLAADAAAAVASATDWHPWVPRFYADGTTPIDTPGNPIYDGRSERLDRAYQIIQGPGAPDRSDDEPEIAAWVNRYDEELDEMPRSVLFIHLRLTEDSAGVAQALLRTWMTPGTTPHAMDDFIARVVPAPPGEPA
jgi:hypothetical protein